MRTVMDAAAFPETIREPVHLLVTDPPWKMYAGERWPNGKDGGLKPSDRFLKAAPYGLISIKDIVRHLRAIRVRMVPGGHAYVFLPAGEYFEPALRALIDDGWEFQRLIVWDKAPHGGYGLGATWRNAFEPVAFLTNGPPRDLKRTGAWGTVLRQRPKKTRTSKPPQLYRVFIEASTRPGELCVDPYAGLDPLQEAAQQAPPPSLAEQRHPRAGSRAGPGTG